MISDLSPGDKLSLKGKIFELQKKLQIIDIRNKQKEEFSYKPTLYNYNLPDRHNNVLESINKAEIIRKVNGCRWTILRNRTATSFSLIAVCISNERRCWKLQY
jgi:hypothetical protein